MGRPGLPPGIYFRLRLAHLARAIQEAEDLEPMLNELRAARQKREQLSTMIAALEHSSLGNFDRSISRPGSAVFLTAGGRCYRRPELRTTVDCCETCSQDRSG